MERLAPIVLHERALAPDTGGAGRWRGGLGQRMTVEVLTDEPYLFSSLYERARTPAPGLFGGGAGAVGRFTVQGDATPPPKTTATLAPGATFSIALPGGGGYGDPAERPAERVAEDVAEGYVSEAEARRLYPAYAVRAGGD
jgi:N-methylhydantoinase B